VKFTKNYEVNWSRKGHIYRDYYLYKYSLGLSAACSIAKNLLEDKTGVALKKYKEFLRIGGAKDPISSLKVAGVDVLDGKFYDGAFAMFEDYLNQLKVLAKEKK
jgi:oligoendopeptidase F